MTHSIPAQVLFQPRGCKGIKVVSQLNNEQRKEDDALKQIYREIHSVLPEGVVLEVARISSCIYGLMYEESLLIQNAIEKRRMEFNAGRVCAHRALVRLGVKSCAILVGKKRQPLWPDNVVGSITHDGDHCVVVVGHKE